MKQMALAMVFIISTAAQAEHLKRFDESKDINVAPIAKTNTLSDEIKKDLDFKEQDPKPVYFEKRGSALRDTDESKTPRASENKVRTRQFFQRHPKLMRSITEMSIAFMYARILDQTYRTSISEASQNPDNLEAYKLALKACVFQGNVTRESLPSAPSEDTPAASTPEILGTSKGLQSVFCEGIRDGVLMDLLQVLLKEKYAETMSDDAKLSQVIDDLDKSGQIALPHIRKASEMYTRKLIDYYKFAKDK